VHDSHRERLKVVVVVHDFHRVTTIQSSHKSIFSSTYDNIQRVGRRHNDHDHCKLSLSSDFKEDQKLDDYSVKIACTTDYYISRQNSS